MEPYDSGATLSYAAQQLAHYGRLMDSAGFAAAHIALRVCPDAFAVEDPQLDDAVDIRVECGCGEIAASNARAALIGVYCFLRQLGCRFLRPGADGECVPSLPLRLWTVRYTHAASRRYRGVVIEGANSLEQVLSFLSWMPKLGFNMFFTQFESMALFFRRFYSHAHNPLRSALDLNDAQYAWMQSEVERHLQLLGLLQHAVGHGWTCRAVGVPGCDWEPTGAAPAPGKRAWLAQVGGQRAFYGGIPAETNLCMSNPAARGALTNAVVDYAQAHPHVPFIHVWLADNCHNFCECGACAAQSPSDWYVVFLNELDEALSARGLPARIVFLNYFDLLWPPKVQMLHNPQRFVMIFAPITRSFVRSFADAQKAPPPAPYRLNRSPMPAGMEENIALLREWQKTFSRDCFDFDYYMGRAHYGDPGYAALAHLISRDIDTLPALGLNGILSCQELRAAFPTNLPSYLLGTRLWDSAASEESVRQEYYSAAFGSGAQTCAAYLDEISACFDADYWYHFCPQPSEAAAAGAARALRAVRRWDAALTPGPQLSPTQALSWYYLRFHLRYVQLFAQTILCQAQADAPGAKAAWEQFSQLLTQNEQSVERVLDVFRILDLGSHMPWNL